MSQPGEMLLRLRDVEGNPLPPYPAIMAFYNNGMAAEIDTILALCAVQQFKDSDEQQISVNVSGRSMRDATLIKTVLPVIEAMKLPKAQKIIFEIHESAPSEIMSPRAGSLPVLRLPLMMSGVVNRYIFRLSQFE